MQEQKVAAVAARPAKAEDRKQPPADLDVQLAWSYLDADGREKELYALLTTINLRNDLTPSQRESVRKIWSTWSLRRSQQALEAGDEHPHHCCPGSSDGQQDQHRTGWNVPPHR